MTDRDQYDDIDVEAQRRREIERDDMWRRRRGYRDYGNNYAGDDFYDAQDYLDSQMERNRTREDITAAGQRDRGFDSDLYTEYERRYPTSRQRRYERGAFRGVGPKGYKRSDDLIEEEASERLMWHGWIDASNITVTVEDSEITLTGEVDNRATKRLAEDTLEAVLGVRDIHNRLTVRRDSE